MTTTDLKDKDDASYDQHSTLSTKDQTRFNHQINSAPLKRIAFLNCNSQRHQYHWPTVVLCGAILISTLMVNTKSIDEVQANISLSKAETLRLASLINHHPDQPFPSRLPLNDQLLPSTDQPNLLLAPPIESSAITESATSPDATAALGPKKQRVTVRQGETLAKIFKRFNLPSTTLLAINHATPNNHLFFNIKSGDQLELEIDANQQLSRLVIPNNPSESIQFSLQTDASYRAELIKKPIETQQRFAEGVIDNSFYLAAQKAGLNDQLIMKLEQIFTWDIDFSQDIHRGDRFEVLYEQKKMAGQLLSAQILAARFTTQGRQTTAIAFTDNHGETRFYNPQGMGIKKPFKRNPVDYARISSHFNSKRFHPILHTMRAHKGVDYAAKTGTPIKATGDGKIIFAGRKGGYGNTIVIQHGQNITTLYGHLHKFAPKLKVGDRVKQDQIIGQVGSSGLATGPHLHYEFLVDGVNKNPVTTTLAVSEPIKVQHQLKFRQKAGEYLAAMDNGANRVVARLQQSTTTARN